MEDYLQDVLPDKMRLDQLYVRNHSFLSDLDVILWTAFILFSRIAEVSIPERYLFAGPITCLANRYLLWFLADTVIAFIAVGFVGLFWRTQGPLNWGFVQLAILALTLAILFSVANSIAGLNRIVWSRATIQDGMGIAVSGGAVTLLLLVLNYLQSTYHWLPFPSLPEAMILTIGLVANLGFTLARYRSDLLNCIAGGWWIRRRQSTPVGERVLIVGAGEGCQVANWLLRRQAYRNAFSIVGIVNDEDLQLRGMRVHGSFVLGGLADLTALIEEWDVGLVVYASVRSAPGTKEHVSDLCAASNTRLVFLDQLMETISQRLVETATTA
jgi:FlaA1/EpsC-like NDP-sugar epimerase